jgi:hypothetical protein
MMRLGVQLYLHVKCALLSDFIKIGMSQHFSKTFPEILINL